jgi:hypothetical protein
MRRVPWLLVAAGVAGVVLGVLGERVALPALAKTVIPDGSFVRDSGGVTWLVVNGRRAQVPLHDASDDDIAELPDSGLWVLPGGDGATRLALGAAPAATGASSGSVDVVGRQMPDEGFNHAAQDAPLTHQSRPPSSGTHYPTWVQTYGLQDPAPPTGNWLHNLEHGAVVILYNCPDGCPEIVKQLGELYSTLPLGPNARGARARVLIIPYTEMEAKVAAVAWGWRLEQSELNTDELRKFVEQRMDRGPECRDLRCP